MAVSPSMPPSEEARAHHAAQIAAQRNETAWTGWVVFGAAVLFMIGMITVFQGFLALFDEGYFVAAGDQLALVSYDAWGVLLIAWGVLLIAAGSALYAGKTWARWFAILAVMVDMIWQIGFLPAHPLLSIVLIGLDVVVLYALMVRWEEARQGL